MDYRGSIRVLYHLGPAILLWAGEFAGGRLGLGLIGRTDFVKSERLNVGASTKAVVLTTSGPVNGKDRHRFQRLLLYLSFSWRNKIELSPFLVGMQRLQFAPNACIGKTADSGLHSDLYGNWNAHRLCAGHSSLPQCRFARSPMACVRMSFVLCSGSPRLCDPSLTPREELPPFISPNLSSTTPVYHYHCPLPERTVVSFANHSNQCFRNLPWYSSLHLCRRARQQRQDCRTY